MGKETHRVEQRLPDFLKPLFWSYRFDELELVKHKKTIVVNLINYGSWQAWGWLIKTYGRSELRDAVSELPASEFRPRALRLASLLFGIDVKQMKRVRTINT